MKNSIAFVLKELLFCGTLVHRNGVLNIFQMPHGENLKMLNIIEIAFLNTMKIK